MISRIDVVWPVGRRVSESAGDAVNLDSSLHLHVRFGEECSWICRCQLYAKMASKCSWECVLLPLVESTLFSCVGWAWDDHLRLGATRGTLSERRWATSGTLQRHHFIFLAAVSACYCSYSLSYLASKVTITIPIPSAISRALKTLPRLSPGVIVLGGNETYIRVSPHSQNS